MAPLVPENDYRTLLYADPGEPTLRVTVVIPVYNRVALLRRTLAGLSAQQGYPPALIDVVVVDDGSEEDVAAAAAAAPGRLALRVLHQQRDGYGASRARRLGTRHASGDVVLFVDADCLPDPHLVEAHMAWHHRSDRVVVIGSRHGLDTAPFTPEALAAGEVDVRSAAFGGEPTPSDLVPDDWRRTLYRRTNRLVHGTEAFRAVISSNVSVPRPLLEAVGGFDPEFRHWGGEDSELGWRLWAAGSLLVPEDGAIVYHQIQHEGGAPGWRAAGRAESDPLIVDLVPHRFYRKDVVTGPHRVPKVSWVISPGAGVRTGQVLEQLQAQRVHDWEAFFPHDSGAAGDPRIRSVPDTSGGDGHRFLRAVAAARGQYVAVLSGAAAPDPLLLDRTVRLLDKVPRASLATVAAHTADLAAADLAWGAWGMPAFSLTRRREWSKVLPTVGDPAEAWRRVRSISLERRVAESLVTLPDPAPTTPERVDPVVSARTRAAEAARTGGRVRRWVYRLAQRLTARRRGRGRPDEPRALLVHIGDARSLEAVQAMAPWATVATGGTGASAIVIGGGVALTDALADRVTTMDTPRTERIIVGAAQVPESWRDFAATCAAVGVSDPRALAEVRAWGIDAVRAGHPADDPQTAARLVAVLQEALG